MENTSGA